MTHRRLLSITRASLLALVLLLTQQLGVLHVLSHGLAHRLVHGPANGPTTGSVATSQPGEPGSHAGNAADALCQLCLVLATLGAAALPTLWRWLAPRLQAAAPVRLQTLRLAAAASAPYQARGPPA